MAEMDADRPIEEGEFRRWKLNTPIQIYIREDLPHLAGHSKDISLVGMQIEIGVKLPLKSIITMEVYFQRSNVFEFIEQEPLRIKGMVVWRRIVADEPYDAWEAGVRFLDISSEQQNVILDEVEMMQGFKQLA